MRNRHWMKTIGACAVLVAVLASYKVMQIRAMIAYAESFPEQSESVQAMVTSTSTWTRTITSVGEVIAPQAITLYTELAGKIASVGFAPGADVAAGQLLLQLDISEEQAQLQAAQAQENLSAIVLERYHKLVKKNVSSKDDYDKAVAEHTIARARIEELQAVINKKTLRAPFAARTGLHALQVGQYMAANTAVTQLVGTDGSLWVDFSVPQQESGITIGANVTATVNGVTADPLHGKVSAAEPVISSSSRNLRLRALFSDAASVLKPGMMVDLVIDAAPPRDVILLPATAIHHDIEGSYVYVLQPGNTPQETRAARRAISTGASVGQQVIIETGLQLGERIATTGSYKLRDKMLANISP